MSVEDPRLTVWAREQAAATAQFTAEKRVRILERTIGIAAKTVREDLQGQITDLAADVATDISDLADATDTNLAHRILAVSGGGIPWSDLRMSFGVTTVTFAGGSPNASASVTHGLGLTPLLVLCTAQSQSGSGSVNAQALSPAGGTTFTIWIESVSGFSPGAGIGVPVAWIALG